MDNWPQLSLGSNPERLLHRTGPQVERRHVGGMRMRPMPPQALVRQNLHYDPDTGLFVWLRPAARGRDRTGQVAGSTRKLGYVMIGICGLGQFGAHRLAWVYVHGHIPDGMEIDHIDNDPSNNRLCNLRLASSSEQKQNKRVQSNNRSGLKGAYYHACHKGKKWRSQIKAGGRLIFLGYYHTAEEAHQAYASAAKILFGEFACVVAACSEDRR